MRLFLLTLAVAAALWIGPVQAGPGTGSIPITATALGGNQIEVEGCGFKPGGRYSLAVRHYFYVDYPSNPPPPAWEDSLFPLSVGGDGCFSAIVTVPNTDIGSAYDVGLHEVWVTPYSGGSISGAKFVAHASILQHVIVF